MNTIHVKPDYGFGWQQDGGTIDTPLPFTLLVEMNENVIGEQNSRIFGTILEKSHRYAGKKALLSIRTRGQPPTYNVMIYEKSSDVPPADLLEKISLPILATGYAVISIAP